ncbi:MAG: hypothetical protein FWF37_00830 [Chloroflexi bacterium]|nr:hypothetical protein [Chloroflexota bacterium]
MENKNITKSKRKKNLNFTASLFDILFVGAVMIVCGALGYGHNVPWIFFIGLLITAWVAGRIKFIYNRAVEEQEMEDENEAAKNR